MVRYRLDAPTRWIWGLGALGVVLIVGVRMLGLRDLVLMPLFVACFWLPVALFRTAYLLLPGVLWVVSGSQGATAIPLAWAKRRRKTAGWEVAWLSGGGWRSLLLPDPDGAFLGDQPEDPGEDAPRTEQEARGAAPLGAMPQGFWWGALGLVILVGSQALVLWQQEPLLYLPVLLLPWVARQMAWQRLLVLQGETLWLFAEKKEPYPIPLTQVEGIEQGLFVTRLQTTDPEHPVIPVNPFWGSALIRGVKRHLK